MILIIGGAYQGKLDYAKSALGVTPEQVFACTGREIDFSKCCIYRLEEYSLACVRAGVEPAEVDRLCDLLAAAGRFDPIDESLMDSGSVIAGCTGAWACMFIEALADGAVQTGMPRPKAVEYAAQAVLGAAALVLESGKHPGQLKDEVCSPGGSTIVGVHAMETGGVRAAAMDAVTQAFARTKEMGKS